MIDFHSHIVYNVDDGSETIEDSKKILKEAEKAGFDKIILTPHYMEDYYEVPKEKIQLKIEKLQELCNQEDINIELYQANEIYITNHITELLEKGEASSINNSRYVLFEIPMNEEPQNLLEVIYKLIENKYVPVLAHPERYSFVQQNPNKLLELAEHGVLFQANYGSIIGQYGKNAEKTVKLLLQNNFIHFLGSDVHKQGHIYMQMSEIQERLRKILPEEKIEELENTNIEKAIDNKELEIEMPTEIKLGFFSKNSLSNPHKLRKEVL